MSGCSGEKRSCLRLCLQVLVRGRASDGESDNMIAMPEAGPGRSRAARGDRRCASTDRPRRGRDRQGQRAACLRMRRAHRLSPAANGRRAARQDCPGRGDPALLRGEPRESRAAGRRNLAVGRRIAARGRRLAWHGQVQPHPRDRRRQSLRGRRARGDQSGRHATPYRGSASITRPTRPARSPAPSAATSPRIPAASIA